MIDENRKPEKLGGLNMKEEGNQLSFCMRDDTLLHGDCLEKLKHIDTHSIDAIITDPPFAFAGGVSNGFASRADSQFFVHWLAEIFIEMHRCSKPEAAWFLWADWRSLSAYDEALSKGEDYYNLRKISQVIIHDREMVGMGSPFRNQLDYIALVRGKKTKFNSEQIAKNQPNILRSYWYYGKHPHHPSEKCPKLTQRLIEFITPVNGIVLDPFMGSGTTGVACKNSNRNFIGIELNDKYFKIAKKRIERVEMRLSDD